jgi:hypothetical protein
VAAIADTDSIARQAVKDAVLSHCACLAWIGAVALQSFDSVRAMINVSFRNTDGADDMGWPTPAQARRMGLRARVRHDGRLVQGWHPWDRDGRHVIASPENLEFPGPVYAIKIDGS